MQNRKLILATISGVLIIASLMCTISMSETPMPTSINQDEEVVATLVALQLTQTSIAAYPSETPKDNPRNPTQQTSSTNNSSLLPGSISGLLSYPSEFIPPQRVIAFNLETDEYFYIETARNQNTYRIEGLKPGLYHVVAYIIDLNIGAGSDLSAGYSQAVLCGLSAGCTDHRLIEIEVNPGLDTTGINPTDWYAPPSAFPIDPIRPPEAPELALGSISGGLSYPSEGIPPLRVVAFNTSNNTFKYVNTVKNQNTYLIDNLSPGIYQLVSYVIGSDPNAPGGGYSQFVLCGLSAECKDHSLVDIPIEPGDEVTGVDLLDWYAPQGAFPPNPIP